jgi:hypothetical protein
MTATGSSRRGARSIVTVALALTGTLAGLAAGPTVAAESSDADGWYVVVDEHGNAVVPEWNGTVPAGVTAEPVGYVIVGEGGVAYVPEMVDDGATEVAGYVIVDENGVVYVPERAGMFA